jgi:3-oxoacyl-[acyl-carrier protein] reductase
MQGKRFLVTGSSRGIGRAIALKLASNGAIVAIHSAKPSEEATATVKELGDSSGGQYFADLGTPNNTKTLFEQVIADGPLHGLINNAGIYMPLPTVGATASQFEATMHRTFAVNLDSPLRLIHLAANYFARLGGGKIVNVCSRVGFKGEAGAALYAASKASLINATRSLAVELAPSNIQVFGIAPGWVDTAMAREGMQQRLETILKDIPLGRMATPEDCANAVAFLVSPEATYLSGNVVDINGASYFH